MSLKAGLRFSISAVIVIFEPFPFSVCVKLVIFQYLCASDVCSVFVFVIIFQYLYVADNLQKSIEKFVTVRD